MTIEPGDSISASVQYIASGAHAGDFELSITDNSRSNDSFTTYVSSSQLQNPTAQMSSAEWVVETPSLGSSVASLANFGGVTFTNALATINGVTGSINDAAWQSQAMNIVSGSGATQATTSVLDGSGTSFAVTYDSTSSSASPGSGGGWWGLSQEGPESSVSGPVASSSATATVPVFYGTTPPSRKPPFSSARGSLWV